MNTKEKFFIELSKLKGNPKKIELSRVQDIITQVDDTYRSLADLDVKYRELKNVAEEFVEASLDFDQDTIINQDREIRSLIEQIEELGAEIPADLEGARDIAQQISNKYNEVGGFTSDLIGFINTYKTGF